MFCQKKAVFWVVEEDKGFDPLEQFFEHIFLALM